MGRIEHEDAPSPAPAPTWAPEWRGNPVRLTAAIVIAFVLVIPASIYAFSGAGRTGPAGGNFVPAATSSPASVLTAAASSPASSPSLVSKPTSALAPGKGCAATTDSTPKDAYTARVGDVDGDGKADTEWAVQALGGTLRFGITTASGATIASSQAFAGGGSRSFVVGKLANGVVVAITSEGRDSPVYTFSRCAFHTLRGKDLLAGTDAKSPFTLYSEDAAGDGGCYDGRLALVRLTTMPGSSTGDDQEAIARWVDVSTDGLRARLTNETATLARNLNRTTDPTRYDRYNGTSCGMSKVLRPIYHAK